MVHPAKMIKLTSGMSFLGCFQQIKGGGARMERLAIGFRRRSATDGRGVLHRRPSRAAERIGKWLSKINPIMGSV